MFNLPRIILIIIAFFKLSSSLSCSGIDDTNWTIYKKAFFSLSDSIGIPSKIGIDYCSFNYKNSDSNSTDSKGHTSYYYYIKNGKMEVSKAKIWYSFLLRAFIDNTTYEQWLKYFNNHGYIPDKNDTNRLSNGLITVCMPSDSLKRTNYTITFFPAKFPNRAPVDTAADTELVNNIHVENLSWAIRDSSNDFRNFFWDSIANKPGEEQFAMITSRNWKAKRKLFESKLCDKTISAGHDVQSLKSCFSRIHRDQENGIAYLPISVYYSKYKGHSVALIFYKWEYAGDWKNYQLLGHICMWAIDIKNLKILSFFTCG